MNSNEKKNSATRKTRNHFSNSEKVNTDSENPENSKLTISESKVKKKVWSVKALIESMKPSSEELKFREEKLKEYDILQKSSKLFRCTKCMLSFNSLIRKHKKLPIHPILGVLMCQKCCDYYEDGEFSFDSEGEDKYCRWCGEGGTIFGCAKCVCGFCASCIKRHFKINFFKRVKGDDNWLCFICDPKPLWSLRFICSQAVQASEAITTSATKLHTSNTDSKDTNIEQSISILSKSSSGTNSDAKTNGSASENVTSKYSPQNKRKNFRKRICISSSDESEHESQENLHKKLKLTNSSLSGSSKEKETESFENIKSNVLGELEKVLKLSEYQLSFGVSWSNKMLKKLGSSDFLPTNKNLANECQKIKWFLSLLSTYLVQFCNSINSIEKTLLSDDGTKISSAVPDKNDSPYITILQFLGFINSQIKTFMEKGISLSDILEAEVYDDENIIGLKKKINYASGSFKEKNVNPVKSKTNFTSNENEVVEIKEGMEEQKADKEGRDRGENSLDVIGDQNSEMNSTECDKEQSNSIATLGEEQHLKPSNPEEDIQEILAILENA